MYSLLTMMKYGELINQYDSIGNTKNVCWILAGFGYLPKSHVGLEICNRIKKIPQSRMYSLLTMMKHWELINQYDSIGNTKIVCWILAGFGYLPKFHVGIETFNRMHSLLTTMKYGDQSILFNRRYQACLIFSFEIL